VLIAVSGYGQTEDQKRSREVGFDHHLVKPADFSALERILESVRRPSAGPSTVVEFPAPRLRANS
jgi:DNA-binding response OmpR family regulator